MKENGPTMSGDNISCSECTMHLGISRNVMDNVNVEEKVGLGRKKAYSLMGARFHRDMFKWAYRYLD